MRRSVVLLLVFAACVLVPGTAWAARPGKLIGNGGAPSIAVDATGTGYVAWNDQPPGQVDEPVALCVIAKGRASCSSRRDVMIDGQSDEAQPPLISATGHGQLALASGRCCSVGDVETFSSDGGATFTAPAVIGDETYLDGAIGPAGQVLFVGDTGGVTSQLGSIGAPADTTATLIVPSRGLSTPTGWAGSTPVVVGGGTETIAAIYSGSGDPNDGANWRNVRVPGSTFNPSVASGPHGLYLLQDTGPSHRRLTVRKFTGHGFGRAHVVAITKLTDGTALTEDAAGRLVAAWYADGKLFAAASRDGGVHWSRPHVIGSDVPSPDRMQAALGPDGRGWLVYSVGSVSQIRLIRLNARALLGIKHRAKKPKPSPPGPPTPPAPTPPAPTPPAPPAPAPPPPPGPTTVPGRHPRPHPRPPRPKPRNPHPGPHG